MQRRNFILAIILFELIGEIFSYGVIQPVWLTSPFFRAGNNKVIETTTGNDSTPTYTFTFSSSLSGIPNLGYGVKNYRGEDTLKNQNFEIRRVSLSSSTFTVSMQIFGFTNIYLLTVPYLAIDPLFPHHLNSFDNVPLNFSSGPLVNLNRNRTTPNYHTQVIDYTQQSAANTYKTFTTPLSSNKIVLFLTSFGVLSGGNQPLQFSINYTILNESHYQWTARIFKLASVSKLHLSQIVYNQDDVLSSNTYAIVNKQWTVTNAGGFQSFPFQLVDNMIMAITDFDCTLGACGFQYNWDFMANYSGSAYGIQINPSVPANSTAACGMSRARSIQFYIKTWQCGAPYVFFNLSSNNCQDGCADYFFANHIVKICQKCYYTCFGCSAQNDKDSCTVCQAGLQRVLQNDTCICGVGYFDDGYSPGCRKCQAVDIDCVRCGYTKDSLLSPDHYESVFALGTWPTDIVPDYVCYECKPNRFLNLLGVCQACSLQYCLTCQNLTACSVCDSSVPAFIYTDKLCYLCSVAGCLTCSADNICQQCGAGYFHVSGGTCELCSVGCACDGWVLPLVNGTCSTLCGDGYLVGSQECDDGNTDPHDGCSATCTIQPCNVSCLCDGWTHPWVDESCSTICGDNLIRGKQECQSNYTIEGYRCNQNCLNQLIVVALLQQQQTQYSAIAIFAFGFRIIGMEMLNVFQNFQLLLKSQQYQTFQISWNVHGYTNSQNFPFQIPQVNHMFSHFNFMFIIVLGFFALSVILQLLSFFLNKNNKIQNAQINQQVKSDNQKVNSQENPSQNSEDMGDFAVHYKNNHKGNKHLQKKKGLNSQQQINQPLKQSPLTRLTSLASVLFRQIFFDLLINVLCVFVYSMTEQIKYASLESLAKFSSIATIGSMVGLLVFLLAFCSIQSSSFGENQLKFHQGKWMVYWILTVGQRIVFSTLLASNQQWSLYTILALKFSLIVYFSYSQIYFEKIQKRRSLAINILHFILILMFVLNQKVFKTNQNFAQIQKYFIEYIYVAILASILLITAVFYIREILKHCRADFRNQDQNQLLMSQSHGAQSAVFDAKTSQIFQDTSHSFQHKFDSQKSPHLLDDSDTIKYLKPFSSAQNLAKHGYVQAKTKKIIGRNSRMSINQNLHVIMQQESKQKDLQLIKADSDGTKNSNLGQQNHRPKNQQDNIQESNNNNNHGSTVAPKKRAFKSVRNVQPKNELNQKAQNNNQGKQNGLKHTKSAIMQKNHLKNHSSLNQQKIHQKHKDFLRKSQMSVINKNNQNKVADKQINQSFDAVSINLK